MHGPLHGTSTTMPRYMHALSHTSPLSVINPLLPCVLTSLAFVFASFLSTTTMIEQLKT